MALDATRRKFVATTGAATAAALLSSTAAESKTDVWVIHSEDKSRLMNAALKVIEQNGGFGVDVKKLTLKVNAAWARTPEEGANTHPELVDAFIAGALRNGVKELLVPEHPCNRAEQSFVRSGIKAACKKHKIKMVDLKKEKDHFRPVKIPGGVVLKEADVAVEYLETDCVVNMPVAKHHKATKLSMAMKNWLGVVLDRREWHRAGLHQCIADFSTFIKPNWTIIDATRCMLDSGPQGPADEMLYPDLLIVSKDQVAADTYAATLFHDDPLTVEYLRIAGDMGIGQNDLSKMNIHKLEA
ncbi:DUF362 domain-containing protein [Verrucomicrobiota bacterium]